MNRNDTYRSIRAALYVLLAAAALWQAWRVVNRLRHRERISYREYVLTDIDGNVVRPGRYRVPRGTSRFELLQVAGLRETSDLSGIALDDPLDETQRVTVGTLGQAAGARLGRHLARLEMFFGAVQVLSSGTSLQPRQPGLLLAPGDAVVTDSSSQAELSLGPYCRVDLDVSTELVFEKIGSTQQDRTVSEVLQKSGSCWYRVVYASRNERFNTLLADAVLTPGGTGADYLAEIQPEQTRIFVLDGQLRLTRPAGDETLSLTAGQTAIISAGRPYQLVRGAATPDVSRRFSRLQQQQSVREIERSAMINFVFCALPSAYYFISVRFDNQTVQIVSIPANTAVDNYAQGFNTLNEAYLLGGPLLVQNLVEQLVSTRVDRYCALEPPALRQMATLVGSMVVYVDADIAGDMGLAPGRQRIRDGQILDYVKPRSAQQEANRKRQWEVLRGLYEELRAGDLVLGAALAERLLALMGTNFTVPEVLSGYRRFSSTTQWTLRQLPLAGSTAHIGRQTVFQPDRQTMRETLFGS